MWPECGPKAARMRPEFKILRPEISPCKFPVARAQPGLKLQARNPTRTMKKVARPSPMRFSKLLFMYVSTWYHQVFRYFIVSGEYKSLFLHNNGDLPMTSV